MTTIKAIRFFEFMIHSIGRANLKTQNRETVECLEFALAALQDQYARENPRPLTIEELKVMNSPVWVSCKTLEGTNGYWCLCNKGLIICPSGQSFDVKEIPHWNFLTREPKEE